MLKTAIIGAILAGTLTIAAPLAANDLIPASDFSERRAGVADAMQDGDVAVLFTNKFYTRSNDTKHQFHPDVHLRYLSGSEKEESRLLLEKKDGRLIATLFAKASNPQYETWIGKLPSFDSLKAKSAVDHVKAASDFENSMDTVLGNMSEGATLWLDRGRASNGVYSDSPANAFAADVISDRSVAKIGNLTPTIMKLREIKSEHEIKALRAAVDASMVGFRWAMKRSLTAEYEYQVEAALEAGFRDQSGEAEGYESIVAAGANANILHYQTNQEPINNGDLILVDAAAEVDGYSADITRTYPSDGTFTDAQKDIYQAVLDGQQAAIDMSKPGASMASMAAESNRVITAALMELGLITEVTPEQTRFYILHGLGHGIGLDVHDPNPSSNLAAGAVFTIEPGVYVRAKFVLENEAFKKLSEADQTTIRAALDKYDGIGVRIEDDILITEDGYENLSADLPRSIEAIEAMMAK